MCINLCVIEINKQFKLDSIICILQCLLNLLCKLWYLKLITWGFTLTILLTRRCTVNDLSMSNVACNLLLFKIDVRRLLCPYGLAFTCALSRGEIKGDSCARAVPSYGRYTALRQNLQHRIRKWISLDLFLCSFCRLAGGVAVFEKQELLYNGYLNLEYGRNDSFGHVNTFSD